MSASQAEHQGLRWPNVFKLTMAYTIAIAQDRSARPVCIAMSTDPADLTPPNPAPSINPYAPSASIASVAVPTRSDVEEYRRRYLNHEASVKSIGFLYGLGALFSIPVGLFALGAGIFAILQGDPSTEAPLLFMVGVLYTGLGCLNAYAAIGLRRLTNGGRIAGIVVSCFGLIGFPVGTLISIYFLYLLVSQKGKTVCSEPYRQVIAQTPHIKYKTSVIVWILFGILVFVLLLGFSAALFV